MVQLIAVRDEYLGLETDRAYWGRDTTQKTSKSEGGLAGLGRYKRGCFVFLSMTENSFLYTSMGT